MNTAEQSRTRKKRILIVDEEIDVLMELMEILAVEYDLILCNSGYHAVDNLNSYDIDIILLCHDLPEMTGLQLFYLIKRMRPRVRTIFLFGAESPEMVIEALRAGIDDYIVKPLNPEQLKQILKKVERDIERQEYATVTAG
ncbi:MAG: response regulator, partial [Candidatus Odinarchaeota archaeon]